MGCRRSGFLFFFLFVFLFTLSSSQAFAAKRRGGGASRNNRLAVAQNNQRVLLDFISKIILLQNPEFLGLQAFRNFANLGNLNFDLNNVGQLGANFNALDPGRNGFNSNAFFNNNFSNPFLGSNGLHSQQPIFGDTAKGSSGSRQFSSIASGGFLCQPNPEAQVCSRNVSRADMERQVQSRMARKVSKAMDFPGPSGRAVTSNEFQTLMAFIERTSQVPYQWKAWYSNYLNITKGDLDLSQINQEQKANLIQSISEQQFNGDKERAKKSLATAKVLDRPDLNDPIETQHFLQTCGATNSTNNAFACPFHSQGAPLRVFICGGRKEAALIRGSGNPKAALADLSHTVAHELGHLIGPEMSSPFQGAMADVSDCNANQLGIKSPAFRFSGFNSEMTADVHAANVLVKNLEKGETQGLNPDEYVLRSLERLCGTTADESHPAGDFRIRNTIKILREKAGAREVLKCPRLGPNEMVCSLSGTIKGKL